MKPTNVPRRESSHRKRGDRRLRRETWAVILAAGALLAVILSQALSYGN